MSSKGGATLQSRYEMVLVLLQVPPSASGGWARCRGSMGRHQQVNACFSQSQASACGHYSALLVATTRLSLQDWECLKWSTTSLSMPIAASRRG